MGYAVALVIGLVLGAALCLASLTIGRLGQKPYRTPPPTHRDPR